MEPAGQAPDSTSQAHPSITIRPSQSHSKCSPSTAVKKADAKGMRQPKSCIWSAGQGVTVGSRLGHTEATPHAVQPVCTLYTTAGIILQPLAQLTGAQGGLQDHHKDGGQDHADAATTKAAIGLKGALSAAIAGGTAVAGSHNLKQWRMPLLHCTLIEGGERERNADRFAPTHLTVICRQATRRPRRATGASSLQQGERGPVRRESDSRQLPHPMQLQIAARDAHLDNLHL